MKRFIVAFAVAYIFIFFWGWLLNGALLRDLVEMVIVGAMVGAIYKPVPPRTA